MNKDLLIGLDFGSDSVRALLVSSDGEELGKAVCRYPRWSEGLFCNAKIGQFRQHPLDYIEAMETVLKEVISKCDPACVRGIGVDTTGSTPCAIDENGVPLALLEEYSENPDAMFILWKDHTAIREADRINEAIKAWGVDYAAYSGGTYSCEWFWSKILHCMETSEAVRGKAHGFIEHCDWIPAVLTGGTGLPGRCAAGHKAMWHKSWGGLPPAAFWGKVSPLLEKIRNNLYTDTYTAEVPVGKLSEEWASRLGLSTDVVVSGGVIDCHAGAVGAGIKPGQMVKIMGTSTCDIIVAQDNGRAIEGICGQVDGSVLPGFLGLEAGQSAFGDIYAWFQRLLSYGGGKVDIADLEKDAEGLPDSDVLAIDWFNGRRTPNLNPELRGALFGLTLGTDAPMIYRALVESTAFGTRAIFDHIKAQGVGIDEVKALGGIAKKSPFVMQICADAMGVPIEVVGSDQACALGSAIFAAVASGCYPSVKAASEIMHSKVESKYIPKRSLDERYSEYRRMAKWLDSSSVIDKEVRM